MYIGEVIGSGNTATVYDWQPGKVIKLFRQGYPKQAVDKEFNNAKAISGFDFGKPAVHEIILRGEQWGIIYDKVEGESLENWVLRTGDVKRCALHMARLHQTIIQNTVVNVQNYKEFLKLAIHSSQGDRSRQIKPLVLLDALPKGESLCHGDFHPGNIFISNGKTKVVDFMNVCWGPYLYDVARTVFLVEYTPVPFELDDRELVLRLKKELADLYLAEMDVSRERIEDYLVVIQAARVGECGERG